MKTLNSSKMTNKALFVYSLNTVKTVKSYHWFEPCIKTRLRVYKKCEDLPKGLEWTWNCYLSTSEGLLTDKEARQKNVGGVIAMFGNCM